MPCPCRSRCLHPTAAVPLVQLDFKPSGADVTQQLVKLRDVGRQRRPLISEPSKVSQQLTAVPLAHPVLSVGLVLFQPAKHLVPVAPLALPQHHSYVSNSVASHEVGLPGEALAHTVGERLRGRRRSRRDNRPASWRSASVDRVGLGLREVGPKLPATSSVTR